MLRAIGYKRVSTEKQVNEGQGLEVQEKNIKKYCKEQKIQLDHIFSDEGISGAEDLDRRVGLGEALSFIRENKIDYIIITKQDRLARDTELYYWLAREIKLLNCQIISTDQKIEENPTGKLLNIFLHLD
ncbi:MAG: recombinase family protein [Cetobacterium sp.]